MRPKNHQRHRRSMLRSGFEKLESRWMLASTWQNPGQPLDANDDLIVTPIDALVIINFLNKTGSGDLAIRTPNSGQPYYDTDGNGMVGPIDALRPLNALNRGRPIVSARLSNDTAPNGLTNDDRVSQDAALVGRVSAGVADALWASIPDGEPVDISSTLNDQEFVIDETLLNSIVGTALPEGSHTIELVGMDSSEDSKPMSLSFVVDRTPPSAFIGIDSTARVAFDSFVIAFDEPVDLSGDRLNAQIAVDELDDGSVVAIDSVEILGNDFAHLILERELSEGSYQLEILSEISDLAGNRNAIDSYPFELEDPAGIEQVTPREGESLVKVGRDIEIRLDEPIDPARISSDAIQVLALGSPIAGTVTVSATEDVVRFKPDDPMPGSTEIRLVVDGDQIIGRDGLPVDADGDNLPGGKRFIDFRTVPLTLIPNTAITGRVLRSNVRTTSGSPEEIGVGGVTIRVDGHSDILAVTDANGNFTLTSANGLPAPELFVVIDGSTASDVPDGFMYPTLGKPFHSVPGKTADLKAPDGQPFQIFLPLMNRSDAVTLNAETMTPVGFGDGGLQTLEELFPNSDPTIWQRTKVMFPPGSAQDESGNAATDAAIVPVAPDRLPAPLPSFLAPELVISIQAGDRAGMNAAGGATRFDVPAEVSFPNMENLNAGEQALVYSFDHDAGEWIVVGTGTVSDDGTMIDSDGGVIRAPGWHFVIAGTQNPFVIGEFGAVQPDGTPCAGMSSLACGFDFLHDDFVSEPLSLNPLTGDSRGGEPFFRPLELDLISRRRFLTDYALTNDFNAWIILLTGNESVGKEMITRFISGSGETFVHEDDGVLSSLVKESRVFENIHKHVVDDIDAQIKLQASGGRIDNREIVIPGPGFRPFDLAFELPDLTLKSLIGNTQGNLIVIEDFSAEVTEFTAFQGGRGTYKAKITYVLGDDFGVDRSDIYAPPLADFWVLQHERPGPAPFVNQIYVTQEIDGEFDIPKDYETYTIDIEPRSVSYEPLPFQPPRSRLSMGGDSTYYAYRTADGSVFRGSVDPNGAPESTGVVLPPNEFIEASFYQPSTDRYRELATVSSSSGALTLFTDAPGADGSSGSRIELTRFGGEDSDDDGVSDIGEFVLGTNAADPDSDGDGVADGAELEFGLNPLDGFASSTGIVATVDLGSQSQSIEVAGDNAYVTHGNQLSVINISQFDQPITQGRIQLPSILQDVAVDRNRELAVLTTALATYVVDISDPMMPTLQRTIDIGGDKLSLSDGIAYIASGMDLSTVDVLAGEIIDTITLTGGGRITSLAIQGDALFLFAYDYHPLFGFRTKDSVFSIDIANPEELEVLDRKQVTIETLAADISIDNDVLWLTGSGLRTIDISDPSNMNFIQQPEIPDMFSARQLALNGSGLGILIPDGGNFVQVYDTNDPANVADLVTQFDLTEEPVDLQISRGIAYVAAGSQLTVVNYRSFDSLGVPPTVEIVSTIEDIDPEVDGIQVLEGTTLRIQADVFDDVQVRDVTLFANDANVDVDVSFPFEMSTFAPLLTDGPQELTLRVEAMDTGRFSGLSNVLSVQVVPDTFAPSIESVAPTDNTSFFEGQRTLRVRFNEPLGLSSITSGRFEIVGAGADELFDTDDDVSLISDIRLRDDDHLVELPVKSFSPGQYQLRMIENGIVDRAGNALGNSITNVEFTVAEALGPILANPKYLVGSDPKGIAYGDFNEDGLQDLVTANSGSADATVLFGKGDGTFQFPEKTTVSLGEEFRTRPVAIVAVDVNSDEHLDFITANEFGDSVSIALGDGEGGFTVSQSIDVGESPDSLATGDFDGNGFIDLVVVSRADDSVSVLLGGSDGLFGQAVEVAVGDLPNNVAVGDFNGDSLTDIVTSNSHIYSDPSNPFAPPTGPLDNDLSILFGNGDGTFQPFIQMAAGHLSSGITTGDFDSDGQSDIVIGNVGSRDLTILFSNGDGTFRSDQNPFLGILPEQLTTGDFNHDGILDLIASSEIEDVSSILLGFGDGTFQAANNTGHRDLTGGFVATDFNRDGYDDVAVVSGNAVIVKINAGDGSFPAPVSYSLGTLSTLDLVVAERDDDIAAVLLGNGDGTLQGAEIMARDMGEAVAADLNRDGITDLVSVSVGTGSTLKLLLGLGEGSFQAARYIEVENGGSGDRLIVADVNDDEFLDVAISNFQRDSVSILLGNGDGTFLDDLIYPVGTNPGNITAADLNNDGFLDLLTADGSSLSVSILQGNGNGTFSLLTPVSVSESPSDVATGDFDSDGTIDLAVSHRTGLVTILSGQGNGEFESIAERSFGDALVPIAVADFDADGFSDFVTTSLTGEIIVSFGGADLSFPTKVVAIIGDWPNDLPPGFGFDITAADFNADGYPDIAANKFEWRFCSSSRLKTAI